MAELLLELLSEEIPARMQARAAADLKRLVCQGLKDAGLAFSQARAFVTPRRLALVVDGLPKRQPDAVEEKKGPRLDAPVQAIQGFLKGQGLASIDDAEVRDTAKGTFYFAVKRVKGQAAAKVLPGVIAESIQALAWPKSMRWGGNRFAWVRPLHGVLAVFDGRRLAGALELGNGAVLAFGNTTRGHRFLKPGKFRVTGFADYQAKLEQAKVILDPAKRRAAIVKQARRKAAQARLELADDPALLDEVTGLVEWPVVLLGRIEERFMDLPPEVLTTAMRAHQKYLALRDKDGDLAPRFLVVANTESADKDRVRSAARLCKADLVTGMVGEFPELQGIMGRYYALADGEHAEVAEAIAEHYAPQGPNDACPSAPVSVAVALADKIDTLVAFFRIDEKPTGSKDPFALRRAALGVIRLIVETAIAPPISPLATRSRASSKAASPA